jgi:hypothetical protein
MLFLNTSIVSPLVLGVGAIRAWCQAILLINIVFAMLWFCDIKRNIFDSNGGTTI